MMAVRATGAIARRWNAPSPQLRALGAMALALGGFLFAGCDKDEDCKDPIKSHSCPSASRPTSATLVLTYSDPSGYDSVIVEVFKGNADDGTRIRRFRAQAGTGTQTYSFGESDWGDFAGKATYYGGKEIDDVFDGGDLGVNSSTDECGCTSYSVDDLDLDLDL